MAWWSSKKYEVLFQNMAQGAFFQEQDGALSDVNSAALEMFGLTRDEFLGRTSLHPEWRVIKEDGSHLPPEQHPSILALTTGENVRDFVAGVYNPQRKTWLWFSINATPIFEGEDKPCRVFVTLHDITSQLQMNRLHQSRLNLLTFAENHTLAELLVETLNKVETLTDSSIGFFHFYDSRQKTITLSAWSTNTAERFCNVKFEETHYPLEKAGVWVDCVREDQPVIHNDYSALPHRKGLPEGHAAVIRELVVPVKRHGEIVAILGIGNKPVDYTGADVDTVMLFADLAWDIAENKRSEQILQQSDHVFKTLKETSMDGYWVVDSSGRIVAVNDTMTRIYGYSQDEFLTKSITDLEVIEDETQIREHIEQIKASGYDRFESRHRCKDGRIIDVEVSTSYVRRTDSFQCFVRNISEPKQAEKALIASEVKFRALFEQAGSYCMILDPNTADGIPVIIDANDAACQMHGYMRDDFIGRPVADIDDEKGKRLIKARTAEIMAGKPIYFENVHVRKDGTSFHVAVNAQRIDIGDSPPLILTTEYDITERKTAEENLKKSEERSNLVIKGSNDAPWDWDLVSNELYYSPQWWQQLGYEPDELPNDSALWERLMHPEDAERINAFFKATLEKPTDSYEVEFRLLHKAEHYVPVLSRGFITRDDDGKPLRVTGTNSDLTERKKTEQGLKDSEERYRGIFNQAAVGVARLAPDGVWLEVNDKLCEIVGYSHDELITKTFQDITHPDDLQIDLNYVDQLLKNEISTYSMEKRYIKKNGDIIWINLTLSLVRDSNNDPDYFISIIEDIDERKKGALENQKLQDQLHQKQKIESIGQLAGGSRTT